MAVTTDEILAQGRGPLAQPTTWANQETPSESQPSPVVDDGHTGVENVSYDNVTMQGAPDNPKNAHEVIERGVVNVANPQQPAQQPETDKEHTTPVDDQQKGDIGTPQMSYVELYKQMNPYKPPTKEDLEKERKRQKREAIFAAIGDGISAMSNLYFTTQYAPNAFDPTSGMAATTKARFDKLKKEREDNQREYMDGFLRAMKMDDDKDYKGKLADLKQQDQSRKLAESNIMIDLKQADIDLKEAKKSGQEYLNDLYRLRGEALAKGMDASVALIEEKIRTERAKQHKLNTSGMGKSSGGTSGGGKYPVFNSDGDVIDHVYTKDEAVSETERNGGTYPGQTRSQSITQQQGRKTKTSTTSTTTTPHAGRKPREVDKTNQGTGGSSSGSGGKKKTNVKWK